MGCSAWILGCWAGLLGWDTWLLRLAGLLGLNTGIEYWDWIPGWDHGMGSWDGYLAWISGSVGPETVIASGRQ